VNGTACLRSLDALPDGVDAAILAIPKHAVAEAVEAAGRRGVGGVVVFSSGYAELGAGGVAEQEHLALLASNYTMALAGPNCLGLVNFVDGVPLTFGDVAANPCPAKRCLAIIAQSGAMALALTYAAQAQGVAVSYTVSTGNEAVLGVEDYLALLLDDPATGAFAILAEQVRRPAELLALARLARSKQKPLVLLLPGRSARAREASRSHTGAIAGEQGALRAVLSREGVVFVATLDELVDTAGLLAKAPLPAAGGVGFMTDSGAAKTLAIDHCSALGLELPPLSAGALAKLAHELPPFATPSNPLDITAAGLNDPSLYARALDALLGDDAVGTAVVAAMPGSPLQGAQQAAALVPVMARSKKPIVYAVFGDQWPMAEPARASILDAGLPLFRSPERALRAVRDLWHFARAVRGAGERQPLSVPPLPLQDLAGEAQAKMLLARYGISVPAFELAATPEAAREAARHFGYPVFLKVASPDIAHKSDAGGVVRVESDAEVGPAFERVVSSVSAHQPKARLVGVLVEEAVLGGVEVIVGARRDPDWGPYVLAGLGGVWAEVLGDSVIVPADASLAEIEEALARLQAFPVLRGARGARARDVAALARTIEVLGALMRSTPELAELEVNPLSVLEEGCGAVALDALVTLQPGRPS
jgi:acyl-CoA synthetase (NDP forming)